MRVLNHWSLTATVVCCVGGAPGARSMVAWCRYLRKDAYGEPIGHGERFPAPDGKRHGFGRRVYQNGNQYEGDWVDDVRHGYGTLKFVDGPAEYAGEFRHGHRTGQGVFVYGVKNPPTKTAQSTEEHAKEAGRPKSEDLATKTSPSGSSPSSTPSGGSSISKWYRYDGGFLNGVFEGVGKLVMGDGRSYVGDFKAGVRHGYGTQILCPDADRGDPQRMFVGRASSLYRPQKYEGQWYQGKPWGRGVLWYPDGSRVQGAFEAGHPNGVCTVVWASGRPINAFFQHGVLLEFIDVPQESDLWRRRAERLHVDLRAQRDPVFAERDLRPAVPRDALGAPLFGDGPTQLPRPPQEAFEIGGAAHSDYARQLREREELAAAHQRKQAGFQDAKKEATVRMALGFLDKAADYSHDGAFVKVNGVLL